MNKKRIWKERISEYTFILSLLLLFLICAMLQSSASSLTTNSIYVNPDGLILYHDFSACIGTSATDKGDWGNTGTLTNSPTWNIGKYGCGVSFAGGSNRYIALPNVAILNFTTGSFTLSSWIYPNSVSGTVAIFGKSNTGNYYPSVDFLQADNKLRFFIYNGTATGIDVLSASVLTANTWQYVSVVWNVSHVCFYYNGILTDACQSANLPIVPDNIYPMYIGNQGQLNIEFNGKIDEAKIWVRALTAEEIYLDYLGTYGEIEKYYANSSAMVQLNNTVIGGFNNQTTGFALAATNRSKMNDTLTALGVNETSYFNQAATNTTNNLNQLAINESAIIADILSVNDTEKNNEATLEALIKSLANLTAFDVWTYGERETNCTNCELNITVNNTETTNNYEYTYENTYNYTENYTIEVNNTNSTEIYYIDNSTNTTTYITNSTNTTYNYTMPFTLSTKNISKEVAFYLPQYQAEYQAQFDARMHPILFGYTLPLPYEALAIVAIFFIICSALGVWIGLKLRNRFK
jgi:hypothetical protein